MTTSLSPQASHTWSSNQAPAMASLIAGGEEVTPQAAMTTVEVSPTPAATTVPDPVPEPAPLGMDWRASRLFDLSEDLSDDGSPAVMRIVVVNPVGDGRVVGTRVLPDYSRFFIQSVSEQDMEKAHIVETFASEWVHLYGRKPRFYSFSGTLLSAPGQQWEAAWDMLYDRYIRGSKCVELGAMAQLTYGRRSVYGYVLGTNKSKDATPNNSVGFTFSMLVAHVEWISGLEILNSQFGVSSIDGLVAQGDLQSLDGVAGFVASQDAAAGAEVTDILNGRSNAANILQNPDTTAARDDLLIA